MATSKKMFYFAYGSNMNPQIMKERCPPNSYKLIGSGRVRNHRLRFSRLSRKWQGGVADITEDPNFVVWGMVYEITEECLKCLNRYEGLGKAYEHYYVRVLLRDQDKEILALTYRVINPSDKDIPPSNQYLQTMIEGAKYFEEGTLAVKEIYIRFLESLTKLDWEDIEDMLLVKGTQNRENTLGMYIAKIHPIDAKKIKLNNKFGIVEYFGKKVLVKVIIDDAVKHGYCHIDQTIRNALGFPGRETFGSRVKIKNMTKTIEWNPLFQKLFPSRSLVLPLYRGSWLDSEKGICVMNEKLISILGLEKGEYVNIYAICPDKNCKQKLHKISRRVYPGVPKTILRYGKEIDYPQPTEFYLDLDGRMALHLSSEKQGYPVIIRPSILYILKKRMLFYGLTLLLGIDAINSLLAPFTVESPIIRLVFTLVLALMIMVVVTYYDVTHKISI